MTGPMRHPGDGPLDEYAGGRLDPRAAARIEDHLEACEACRGRVAAIRGLDARLAALPREIAPRRDLLGGIRRRIEEDRPARADPADATLAGAGSPSRVWLRAAAVVLALAGVGTALWLGADGGAPVAGGPSPVIDAYVRASAELARTVEDRKADLSPAGARSLEASLAVVDAAIRELERARRRDGSGDELLRQLEARHRAKLELLRGAMSLMEES
jgi:hypothetical protein